MWNHHLKAKNQLNPKVSWSGKKHNKFRHGIILDLGEREAKIDAIKERKERKSKVAHRRTLALLKTQLLKATTQIRLPAGKVYVCRGYGVPSLEDKEFLCHKTGMVARPATALEVRRHREYWYKCKMMTLMIIDWMQSIEPAIDRATTHYLNRLLINNKNAYANDTEDTQEENPEQL